MKNMNETELRIELKKQMEENKELKRVLSLFSKAYDELSQIYLNTLSNKIEIKEKNHE